MLRSAILLAYPFSRLADSASPKNWTLCTKPSLAVVKGWGLGTRVSAQYIYKYIYMQVLRTQRTIMGTHPTVPHTYTHTCIPPYVLLESDNSVVSAD